MQYPAMCDKAYTLSLAQTGVELQTDFTAERSHLFPMYLAELLPSHAGVPWP